MIDKDDAIQQENLELLLSGYWYEELPPIVDFKSVIDNIRSIIEGIGEDKYQNEFELFDRIVIRFKSVKSPSYIYGDGVEPITFFEIKNNGALREMQIPNIKYYFAFIYNTLEVYDEIFGELYNDTEFNKYTNNSNSYLVFNEKFQVYNSYEDRIEVIESGTFAVSNGKITNQLAHEKGNANYLEKQGSKLYSVKVDIESFYPNIYTHYLSKIKNIEPYKSNISYDYYFDFLDYYNMKINNNQTKGIVTGVFSSKISSELLMLCIDYEINKILGDKVTYIRYVDDMTFFSDSLEEIYSKLPFIQRILSKYRLRINNDKTETKKNVYNMSYVDIYELKRRFEFLDIRSDKKTVFNKDIFYNIKGYVSKLYASNQKSEIKAIISMINKAINEEKLFFSEEEQEDIQKQIVAYMLQLACLEPLFASRCYKVIISVLELEHTAENKLELLKLIKTKNQFINSVHHDSLLQIWHYYVLSVYDMDISIDELLYGFDGYTINPIILASFVKNEEGGNKEIIDYIVENYSKSEGREGEENYWKKSIMFSKWWLPLLLVYLKDGKNYYNFFESENFHTIYRDIKEYDDMF